MATTPRFILTPLGVPGKLMGLTAERQNLQISTASGRRYGRAEQREELAGAARQW